MRTRRRLALVLAVSTSAATVAGLSGTARSAPAAGVAVKGLHQAFQATPYRGPEDVDATAPVTRLAFTGSAGAGSLTPAAAGAEPARVQRASAAGDETRAGDPLVASWRWAQPPTDTSGVLDLTWWWSSPTATFNDEVVLVAVLADAGTVRERVVGRTEAVIRAGAKPERNTTRVKLSGAAAGSLTVQARPSPTSDSPLLLVHYGAATPSSGEFRAAAVSGRQHNVPARSYRGPKLEVQATSVGRDAAEPTVGVDKDGVVFYAAGAFDALPDGGPTNLARTEVRRSTDGGITWESVQTGVPLDLTTIPPTTLDPYVYVDEDTGRVFNPELYAGCTYLQYSDDKGETWQQSPAACGQPVNDHQTLVTGPPPEGMSTLGSYPNFVYYCFNRVADSSCGRSLDGGLTFLPAGEPAFLGVNEDNQLCGGLHGHIITDKVGNLYLPKGHCGFPWLAISEDAGQTWRRMQVSDQFRAAATHLAVDVDEAGNIYYLWWTPEERVPLLSRSSDGGDTWSEPLLISPPGVFEVNFPTLDAGKAGQIAISFPGTTQDREAEDVDAATRPWNYYVMTSLNADSARPLFVSTTAQPPSDPIHRGNCGPGRCAGMFDFIDVEYSPAGEIWATATDTCTEEANCNTKDGARAPSALGIAIRQLSGPGLAAPVAPPAVERPAARPRPRIVPRPLPATGLPAVLGWAGLAAAVAGGLVVRRRRAVRE